MLCRFTVHDILWKILGIKVALVVGKKILSSNDDDDDYDDDVDVDDNDDDGDDNCNC